MEERERGVTSAEVRSEQSDMSALGGACEATSTTGSVSSAGWMELSGSLRASKPGGSELSRPTSSVYPRWDKLDEVGSPH